MPSIKETKPNLSMGQKELDCVLMLNWIAWNRTVLISKLHTYTQLNSLKWSCFWMLNWIVWIRNVFEIKTILTLNWIVWNRTIFTFNSVKTKTIHILNWNVWIRTVRLNWITFKLCTELFEIELFICIKMDLALSNLQRLICNKTHTNKQTNIKWDITSWFRVSCCWSSGEQEFKMQEFFFFFF